VDAAREELVRVLHLERCDFDRGARSSALPALDHRGSFSTQFRYVRGGFVLPTGLQLVVRSAGCDYGRFVLHGSPNLPVSRDARLAAVVIADQVGAALASAEGPRDREGQG
jgi:hypothetical protein